MEEETYASELVGQTVIISSMPEERSKKKPVGYYLSVHLLNGIAIQNVTRVDFEPIIVNKPIYATLTLLHLYRGRNPTEEQVRVQAYIEIPAIVKEERSVRKDRASGHMPE